MLQGRLSLRIHEYENWGFLVFFQLVLWRSRYFWKQTRKKKQKPQSHWTTPTTHQLFSKNKCNWDNEQNTSIWHYSMGLKGRRWEERCKKKQPFTLKTILSVLVKEKKFIYYKTWVRVVFVYLYASVFCIFVPLPSKWQRSFGAEGQLPGKSDKLGRILVHVYWQGCFVWRPKIQSLPLVALSACFTFYCCSQGPTETEGC